MEDPVLGLLRLLFKAFVSISLFGFYDVLKARQGQSNTVFAYSAFALFPLTLVSCLALDSINCHCPNEEKKGKGWHLKGRKN